MTSVESERTRLVTNNEEITPVDYVHVRRQRRQVCVGVAIACCLGVGLSLAIAIPLANQQSSPSASGTANDGDGKLMMSAAKGAPSQVKMLPVKDGATEDEEEHRHTAVTTSASTITSVDAITTEETTKPGHHHSTWPTRRTRPTEWTRRTLIPRDQTTTQTTHQWATTETATTTPSWLPEECPRVPHLLRSPVDIKDLVDTLWYEVQRIQTFNAPAYVDHVSCSTLKINTTSEPAWDADLLFSWEEGQQFIRWRKQITVHLHRNDSDSADWVETTTENPSTSQFSFLARLDSFLLTYECFPKVRYFPAPAYVIRVFTRDLSSLNSGRYGQSIVGAMIGLADRWGLNNALVSPITIRQRFCDLDVGHE